jgi:dihydroxyacid dehydratase/phosphogluconate dehydratase
MIVEDQNDRTLLIDTQTVGDCTCPSQITAFCFQVTLEALGLTVSHSSHKRSRSCNNLLNKLSRRSVGNTVDTVNIYCAFQHIN